MRDANILTAAQPAVGALRDARESRPAGRSAALALLVGLGLVTGNALAIDDNGWLNTVKGLKPYAELGYTSDSNLIRKSSAGAAAAGIDGKRSDDYWTLATGFGTELEISRQQLVVDARLYHTSYASRDELDHTGGDARAVWRWAYGNLWDGNIGYNYNRKLRELANQETPLRDMLERQTLVATANRWLTTEWRAGVVGRMSDIRSNKRERLDKQVVIAGASLEYISAADNRVGVEARLSDASYDVESGRDYTEWHFGPRVRWQAGPKTRVDARIGYVDREHERFSERDFDGLEGRLGVNWQATPKTSLEVSAWRETSNLDDEIAEYATVTGYGLEPRWAITPKTTLRGIALIEERDFERDSASNTADRVDDFTRYGLWLDWQFLQNGALSIGVENEKRDSSGDSLRDYDSRSVNALLRVGL